MTTTTFTYLHIYGNTGQDAEVSFIYAQTGEICKVSNISHTVAADFRQYQIKAYTATVCYGTDLRAYLAHDAATEFVYATRSGIAYIMSKEEYIAFVEAFSRITYTSQKLGHREKLRLKHESKAMLEYLRSRV